MLCSNLVSRKSNTVEDGEEVLTASLSQEDQLVFASDADIYGTLARLRHRRTTCSAGDFQLWQQACGFTYQEYSLLTHPDLGPGIVKPTQQYCHDWCHCLMVGIFQTVVYRAFTETQKIMGNVWSALHDYLSTWRFPTQSGRQSLRRLFCPKQLQSYRRASVFKCSASEGLAIYLILGEFLNRTVMRAGQLQAVCDAYMGLVEVIDAFVVDKFGLCDAATLRATIRRFLDACITAGFSDCMHPKFHWLLHFPTHKEKFGFLPSCWVHERKHKTAKRFADGAVNTVAYEKTLSSEVLAQQLADCRDPKALQFVTILQSPKDASPFIRTAVSALIVVGHDSAMLQARSVRMAAGTALHLFYRKNNGQRQEQEHSDTHTRTHGQTRKQTHRHTSTQTQRH